MVHLKEYCVHQTFNSFDFIPGDIILMAQILTVLVGVTWLHKPGRWTLLWHSALHSGMMQTDPRIPFQNYSSQWNWLCKDTEVPALPQNLFGKNLWFRAWNRKHHVLPGYSAANIEVIVANRSKWGLTRVTRVPASQKEESTVLGTHSGKKISLRKTNISECKD